MSATPDFVSHNIELTGSNTLALPARAAFLARITHIDQIRQLLAWSDYAHLPRFVVGGGSNLIIAGDYPGLIVRPELAGRALIGEDGDSRRVRVAAGESWDALVRWTLQNNWPGLENLIAIPGTVGAAPVQNIGAYGVEISEFIAALETLDLSNGQCRTFGKAECRFDYRDSLFKKEGWHLGGQLLITAVELHLPKVWRARTGYPALAEALEQNKIAVPASTDIAAAVEAIRRQKLPDPAVLANAGSFFQNPVVPDADAARLRTAYPAMPIYPHGPGRCKLAAGWLIEQAGWKGRRLGPVGMHSEQALVLVNYGGARYDNVRALTEAVQRAVAEKFAVTLVTEPIQLNPSGQA